MQIPIIKNNDEKLKDLVDELNNRLDQIARAFNELETVLVDSETTNGDNGFSDKGAVTKQFSAKFYRFGVLSATNAKNGTLFEDTADGKLKYKDSGGTVTPLT